MFSLKQKIEISEQIQQLLAETNHPELPRDDEIVFTIRIEGKENWSYAVIQNNSAVPNPTVNPWNEIQGG
jgi:hypothetical protein